MSELATVQPDDVRWYADTFERIKDDDLRQAAIVLASFLYHAGNWTGSFRN